MTVKGSRNKRVDPMARWPNGPIARSPDGSMARWPDGPMAEFDEKKEISKKKTQKVKIVLSRLGGQCVSVCC
jgi:hypothetical protein